MKIQKTQTEKIINAFVTSAVVLTSVTLIASGVAISKVNTEYMTEGVRSARVIAEPDSRQIFISSSDNITLSQGGDMFSVEKALPFMPPPINTVYFAYREIRGSKR